MKNLSNIGRFMFAIPFLAMGLMHLFNGSQMTTMVPSFIPGGLFWVYLVGLCQLAFVVSLITKKMLGLSAMLIGIMLILFVLTIHIPGMSNPDQMMKMMAMVGMLKDLGLAGGAFMLSAMYAEPPAPKS